MAHLYAVVKRGKAVGTILTPHVHEDGLFVVSTTRFDKDYVRVPREADLPALIKKGYKLRMSNPSVKNHRSPSLVAPASIIVGAAV
jgi:hypothetical protein